MSPSTEPLSRISTFSRRGDVAGDLAEDDHGLGEYLRLDLAVRADRQHVLPKLDLAFDLAFDGEILAAVQLALDDHGFADIHGLLQSAVRVSACDGLGPGRRFRGRRAVLASPGPQRAGIGHRPALPLHPVSTCGTLHVSENSSAGCLTLPPAQQSGVYEFPSDPV